MTKKPLNIRALNKLLKMPQWFQFLINGLGIYSEELDTFRRLYSAKGMNALSPKVRTHRIRKLIEGYYRGQDIGSHIPGFYPFLIPASSWVEYPDLILAKGVAPPETIFPVVARRTHSVAIDNISLGLHIHAFYVNGLAEVREAILQNKTLPELYITGPKNISATVHEIMFEYPKPIKFISCENVGRDVVPFIKLLPIMRSNGHDLVGHVHIKKSVSVRKDGFISQWSNFLLSSMVGEPLPGGASIDNIAAHFTEALDRPVLYLPHLSDPKGWDKNRKIAEELFPVLHEGSLPERFIFSPGTIFWATPSYLTPFELLDLPWESLIQEPLPSDGTVLHAIERLFGALAFARKDPVAISVPDTVSFVHSQSLMENEESSYPPV